MNINCFYCVDGVYEYMVDILLATYNGEKFLHKQIDSILEQDYRDWILYVRDDGSIDSTPQILEDYYRKDPEKIKIVKDDLGNLGFSKNFKQLAIYSTNQYVLFCDQDDIWKKDKISKELQYMERYEKKYGNVPVLIFSDLEGIDEDDNLIFDSFVRKNKFETVSLLFSKLLFRNVVTGCAVMINRLLLSYMLQMPDKIKNHDHWAALVCQLNGGVCGYLDEVTISYRQHSNNCIGDLSLTKKEKIKKIADLSGYYEGKARSIKHYHYLEQQMIFLKKSYARDESTKESMLLDGLINIWDKSCFKRMRFLYCNNCFPNEYYLKAIMIMYYMFWGKRKTVLRK